MTGVDQDTGEVLDAFRDLEAKVGIPSLSELLPERAKLIAQIAPLRARHGPWGTAESLRKIQLAGIRGIIRAQATRDGRKLSNDQIDDEAHASSQYVNFIIEHTNERAQWIILEGKVEAIDSTLMRSTALIRYSAAEARL